jgi:hypothetical protein
MRLTVRDMSHPDLQHLPRLEHPYYQAFAAVHWTMRVDPAAPGWLDDRFTMSSGRRWFTPVFANCWFARRIA